MPGSASSIGLPAELRTVRRKVLEDYVRSRIIDFVSEPVFAKRLYTSPTVVRTAAQETLAEQARPVDGSEGSTGRRNLKLVYSHTCLSLGCLDNECSLCQNTPHRRCVSNFAAKYLSGDAVKAKCGATIVVEVIDQMTGKPAGQEALDRLHLEVCILEGKSYSEASSEAITEAFLDANTLLVNAQGKELLAPGRGSEHTEDKRVVARFSEGKAELSVNILGSSIAMLTGQKPPFRLLVRAIDSATGRRASEVQWAVSDAFVVATQRVKGAQKAEIPHVEEHVSKIENVGVQTQHKLQDIRAAAQAAGVNGLNVVHNTVNTVGQFKELVESSAKDVPLQETLRKVLNFTSKGWEAAKAHALRAVDTDNRMRIWLSNNSHSRGLLFRCNLGRVDLDSPVGILQGRVSQNKAMQVEVEAMLAQHPGYDRTTASWLKQRAVKCWWSPGHPGWSIWPADSEQFIRGVVDAGDAILSPVQIIAPVPATPHAASQQANGVDRGEDVLALTHHRPPASTADSALGSSAQKSMQNAASGSTGNRPLTDEARSVSLTGLQEPRLASSPSPDATIRSSSLPNRQHMPAMISTTSTSTAPGGLPAGRNGSWPFNVPLLNGQRQGNANLPASPFDIPTSTSTSTSTSLPGIPPQMTMNAADALGLMGGFTFRPGPTRSILPGRVAPTVHSALPNHLPTLSTQELEQIMELQRRLSNEMAGNDPSLQHHPLSILSNFLPDQPDQLPQLLTRLSGLIANNSAALGGPDSFSSNFMTRAPLLRPQKQQPPPVGDVSGADTNMVTQRAPAVNGGGEGEGQMPLKFSGKVSGILDDLSDAMSMLHDLLPSAASDVHLQAQAARSLPEVQVDGATSYTMPSSLPRSPTLNMIASAEGSNGLTSSNGAEGKALKRRRVECSK